MQTNLSNRYEIYQPEDLTWGSSTESGEWTGIVGDVQNNLADFGLVMSLLHERLSIIDYPQVYSSEPLTPISRKALPLPAYLAPARPFTSWFLENLEKARETILHSTNVIIFIGRYCVAHSADYKFSIRSAYVHVKHFHQQL